MKHRVIAALLSLYPTAWRREYGPELRGVLEDRPLHARTITNVLWGGLRQRLHRTEPWVVMGLALMVLVVSILAGYVMAPPPYTPGMEHSHGSWPGSLIGIVVLMGCGCWTVLRHGGTLPGAGLQTMKMGLLGSVPVFVVALLIWTGVLGVIVLGPGDAPTTFAEHGFTIAAYGEDGVSAFIFTPLGAVLMQLAGLVDCWLFGAIGGAIGRAIRHRPLPQISLR
jgi:hypothetical protein